MRSLLVGLAGGAGALCRYGVGLAVGPRAFPWATLTINLSGSFVLGLVLTVALARRWPTELTTPITVGFLGAFTTFSTFAWEGVALSRGDRVPAAVAYIALSVVLGLAGALAGLRAGNAFAR